MSNFNTKMLLWLHRLGPIYCIGLIVYILYSVGIYPNDLTFYFLLGLVFLNGYFCYVKGAAMSLLKLAESFRQDILNNESNFQTIIKEEAAKIIEEMQKEEEKNRNNWKKRQKKYIAKYWTKNHVIEYIKCFNQYKTRR